MTYRHLLRRLWPYLVRQKQLIFWCLASVILLAGVGRLLPNLFGYAIDHGILKGNSTLVLRVAAGYFAVECVRSGLMFCQNYFFNILGNRILYSIRSDLIGHIQNLPIPFFDRNPIGRVVTRATNDVMALGDLFNKGVVSMISDSLSILAIWVAMALISLKLTLVTLIITPPLLFWVISISRKAKIILRDSKKQQAHMNSFVSENISGMKILQLYNRVPRNLQRFFGLSDKFTQTQLKSVHYFALLWPAISLFSAITITVGLFWGGYLSATDGLAIGAWVAFLMHLQDFQAPLRRMCEVYSQLQNSLTSAERLFQLLDEPTEPLLGTKWAEPFTRSIEFKNLSFRYAPHLPWALDGFSFSLRSGESLAIVGRTGSGKSTLVSLLQKFYPIEEGDILFDGLSTKELSAQSLRRRLGVVQQDNFIFRGTLASNITLNDPTITPEKIKKAAEQAQCQKLVEQHPDGLMRKVEERGANLSAGERQLLAFARIFAFEPDILILDEATANVDSFSESLIQKATMEVIRGRTSIIIAHRLSTILNCDRIIVMEHGRIAESGSYAELINKKGAFHHLHSLQFSGS